MWIATSFNIICRDYGNEGTPQIMPFKITRIISDSNWRIVFDGFGTDDIVVGYLPPYVGFIINRSRPRTYS